MRARALAAVFLTGLVVSLPGLIPLRAGLAWARAEATGLSAARVEGVVWNGRLIDARLGAASLGDLRVGLDPFALPSGVARLWLRGGETAPVRSATLVRRGDLTGVENLNAVLPLGLFGLAGIEGRLSPLDAAVGFRDGRCETASGQVDAEIRIAGLPPAALSGDLACANDGAAALTLQGSSGGVDVRAVLALRGDGRVVLNTRLRPADPASGPVLEAAGFAASDDGWVRTDESRLAL